MLREYDKYKTYVSQFDSDREGFLIDPNHTPDCSSVVSIDNFYLSTCPMKLKGN